VIDTPEAAVITAMGLDHVKELGPTMADIAGAKAGIIKPGGRVASYGGNHDADEVIERTAREMGAELKTVDVSRLNIRSADLGGSVFDYDGIENIHLPLAGTYQPKNAALAITALRLLQDAGYKITDETIKSGLESVKWPGRFEVLRREPTVILDGAHNPHGIKATAESLEAILGGEKPIFLMGVMADKDVHSMTDIIAPLASAFVTVTPDNPRAMKAGELAQWLKKYGLPVTACDTVDEGMALAVKLAGAQGVVCALGSLYFSDDIRRACERTAKS
jgi:dihydrofolate synthase/folylpolyglutamate synthase